MFGTVYYREDNDIADEMARFVRAKDSRECTYEELDDRRIIGRVSMYYPTDGREPFGGWEAVLACVADYQAEQ